MSTVVCSSHQRNDLEGEMRRAGLGIFESGRNGTLELRRWRKECMYGKHLRFRGFLCVTYKPKKIL